MELKGKRVILKEITLTKFFIISEREMKKPIGFFVISNSKELQGFFIEPKYRRKGYATEVLETLIANDLIKEIITHPRNTPMQKLLEKLNLSLWLKYEVQEKEEK